MRDDNIVESWDFPHNIRASIRWDDDTYWMNPREQYDNMGTLVDWVSGYSIGDESHSASFDDYGWRVTCPVCDGSGESDWWEIRESLSGYILGKVIAENFATEEKAEKFLAKFHNPSGYRICESSCERCEGNGEIDCGVIDYFKVNEDAALVIPLRFEDYGSSGSRLRESDEDDCNAVIYITKAQVTEEYGNAEDWEERARSYLLGEVETYDKWANGDVYYWTVEDTETDEILESVGGYIGLDEYVKTEARDTGQSISEKRGEIENRNELALAAWRY